MATSSRHRRSGAQKPSGRQAAPEPESDVEAELPADDVDVALPEGGATFAEEAYEASPAGGAEEAVSKSSSSRRSSSRSGRSSRREEAVSKKSDKKSSRRAKYTPEEIAIRRRGLIFAMKLALGLMVLVGAAFAAYWYLVRDDPKMLKAKALLSDIENHYISSIHNDLKVQQPENADKTIIEARAKLENAPDLGRPDIIPLVEQIKAKLADLDADIAKVKRDVRVQNNLKALYEKFAAIGDMDNAALEALDTQAKAFVENPVDPNGGHSEEYTKAYARDVNSIQVKLASIETERYRRKTAETSVPIQEVRGIADNLVQKEKYHDALAKLDDYARKFPAAKTDIDAIAAEVKDSAEKNWIAAKAQADNCYKDYTAIGSPAAQRKQAAEKARSRLKAVIDNYGIDSYVQQAQELIKKFPE